MAFKVKNVDTTTPNGFPFASFHNQYDVAEAGLALVQALYGLPKIRL